MHASASVTHKVEVDQKALVDKILARYATDFGAIRELVQNADDASATEVRVRLSVDAQSAGLSTISVWNNGRVFTDADWLRIRKIAAGNPDEASVGLFGVGFFSVFALTDAPEILSGAVKMSFAWQGSDLIAVETRLPQPRPGAAFVLKLKPGSDASDWMRPEELLALKRMLASLILFTRSVRAHP
jgi:HSP90 family molecular chaperone